MRKDERTETRGAERKRVEERDAGAGDRFSMVGGNCSDRIAEVQRSDADDRGREFVFDRGIGKLRPLNPLKPVLSSAFLNWSGYHLEEHAQGPFESGEVLWLKHVVIVQLSGPFRLECKEGGKYVTRRILPGHASLRPSQSVSSVRSREPAHFITLSLDPTFMSLACCQLSGTIEVDLEPRIGVEDQLIEGICLALRDEVVRRGASGKLYSDSLATSLAIHLACRYSRRSRANTDESSAIRSRPIRQAIDLINDRFHEDLSLREIAAAAGLSPYHFSRQFKRVTGVSPYHFLLRQRIEHAKQLLLRGNHSLAEVATEVGFFDQSHFATHFKRFCGMTPRTFVRQCGVR